jgi:molecular chaperone GrpE (heat shock protein)
VTGSAQPSLEPLPAAGPEPVVPATDGDDVGAGAPAERAVPADPAGALAEAVTVLRQELAASRTAQEHQRTLLEKLHDERQQLRDAERSRLRDPVLRDLVQLADTCARNGRQWSARTDVAPETAEAVGSVLGDVADDIRLVLERQGVDAFAPRVGDAFDRGTARVVTTQPTAEPGLDGTVAEVRKPGYRADERVFRYCDVVVWRYEQTGEP